MRSLAVMGLIHPSLVSSFSRGLLTSPLCVNVSPVLHDAGFQAGPLEVAKSHLAQIAGIHDTDYEQWSRLWYCCVRCWRRLGLCLNRTRTQFAL